MFVQIDGFQYWATRTLTDKELKLLGTSEKPSRRMARLSNSVMGFWATSFVLVVTNIFQSDFSMRSVPVALLIASTVLVAIVSLVSNIEKHRFESLFFNGTLLDTRSMPLSRMMIVRERFAPRYDMDIVMDTHENIVKKYLDDPDVEQAVEEFDQAVEYAEKRGSLAIIDSIAHAFCDQMTAYGALPEDVMHHSKNK